MTAAALGVLAVGGTGCAPVSPLAPMDDPTATRTVVLDGVQRGIADPRNPVHYCALDEGGLSCTTLRFRSDDRVAARLGFSGEQIAAAVGIDPDADPGQSHCTPTSPERGVVYVTYAGLSRYSFHVVADTRAPSFAAYGPDGTPAGLDGGSVERSPQLTVDAPDGGVVCRGEPADRPPWDTLLATGGG